MSTKISYIIEKIAHKAVKTKNIRHKYLGKKDSLKSKGFYRSWKNRLGGLSV